MTFHWLARALLVLSLVTVAAACVDDRRDCDNDSECTAGRVCASGECVGCVSNANCAADQFCCQGNCLGAQEIDRRCGCGTATTSQGGADCTADPEQNSLCLVEGSVATPETVGQGTCGCGCTPAQGGPICAPPDAAGGEPQCSCEENVDCRSASADATGRPHRAADTCTPQGQCVCFSLGTASVCDPDSATPDCTSTGGCASLQADVLACGVPARSCEDPLNSLDDGTGECVNGGCECDSSEDCAGDALNVDTCAFIGATSSCVCNGYTRGDDPSPCPMELTCVDGGCQLDGIVYASEETLLGVLGLPPAP